MFILSSITRRLEILSLNHMKKFLKVLKTRNSLVKYLITDQMTH